MPSSPPRPSAVPPLLDIRVKVDRSDVRDAVKKLFMDSPDGGSIVIKSGMVVRRRVVDVVVEGAKTIAASTRG